MFPSTVLHEKECVGCDFLLHVVQMINLAQTEELQSRGETTRTYKLENMVIGHFIFSGFTQ